MRSMTMSCSLELASVMCVNHKRVLASSDYTLHKVSCQDGCNMHGYLQTIFVSMYAGPR